MTGERKKKEIDWGMNSVIVQCSRICANHDLNSFSVLLYIIKIQAIICNNLLNI
jgi:hypothetical protein